MDFPIKWTILTSNHEIICLAPFEPDALYMCINIIKYTKFDLIPCKLHIHLQTMHSIVTYTDKKKLRKICIKCLLFDPTDIYQPTRLHATSQFNDCCFFTSECTEQTGEFNLNSNTYNSHYILVRMVNSYAQILDWLDGKST